MPPIFGDEVSELDWGWSNGVGEFTGLRSALEQSYLVYPRVNNMGHGSLGGSATKGLPGSPLGSVQCQLPVPGRNYMDGIANLINIR